MPKELVTCYEPVQCNQSKISLDTQSPVIAIVYNVHWNSIRKRNEEETARKHNLHREHKTEQ